MCENHFMFLADMHTKTEGFVRKHVMRVEIAVVRFQTLCELAGRQGLLITCHTNSFSDHPAVLIHY